MTIVRFAILIELNSRIEALGDVEQYRSKVPNAKHTSGVKDDVCRYKAVNLHHTKLFCKSGAPPFMIPIMYNIKTGFTKNKLLTDDASK
ncbi:unnamed protein product [Didymodactylos carnosus]|uniref:Uncharacterized protein n=1 Tax=Didymodactylos carnosus TaxID=1234261 RepID=A0A8S2ZCE1_9BILA|nr:unnamed protein product [Didymodactylos carnosus]